LVRAVLFRFSTEDSIGTRHDFLLGLVAFPITIGSSAIKQHKQEHFSSSYFLNAIAISKYLLF
jgi:hypothetical protein